MAISHSTPMQILLVEDSNADARIIREMLREIEPLTHLNIVQDGDDALAFLRRQNPYANAPRPDSILLDLHLPRTDGFAVLREIHDDPMLRTIPVVVCLGSGIERERLEPYNLLADCFFVKGYDPDELRRVLTRCPAVTGKEG